MAPRGTTLAPLAVATLPALSPSPRAQQAGERAPPKADGATVPFEMLPSSHMVVEARLNGKGPYRLVFDVGSPITLLSGKAAEGSGAIKKGAPKSFLFGMRGEGKVDELEVGD